MKEILYSLLELDSIYGVISWEERMRIHFYIKGKLEDLTPRIEAFARWIETHQWEAPMMEYKSDRILYYFQNKTWREMEQYAKDFPLTTKTINELKSKYNGTTRND